MGISRNNILALLTILGLCMGACPVFGQHTSPKPAYRGHHNQRPVSYRVPYRVAQNYFVKNTYEPGMLRNPKVATRAEFDLYFGAATVMGNDGKPSAIDFSKEYVIAVIPEASDRNFTLKPVSLRKSRGTITLKYQFRLGDQQSFTSQPLLLLIVNRKYSGRLRTVKIA